MLRKAIWAAALAASLPAQSIVPSKAGLVSYAEEAYIDGHPVEKSSTRFVVVNQNAVLRTGAGRAEVLLGPCAAMWIDENSSFRMISSALSDARLEVLTGSVIVASGAMVKGSKLSLLLQTLEAAIGPKGAYRFDTAPARVEALAGRATVQLAKQAISLSPSRLLLLDAPAHVDTFDKRNPDAFQNWSNKRAALLARLSLSANASSQPSDTEKPSASAGVPRQSPISVFHGPAIETQQPLPGYANSGCGVTAW
jgi:hypothetical protein